MYYRPDRSTASIYLNALLYRELLAFGSLLEELERVADANRWRGRAEDLAEAVRTHLWDERDGTFYSGDLALREIDPEDWLHRGAPRTWSVLLLRIDNWSSFLPMWAGIATQAQAERMRERFRTPGRFRANYGCAPSPTRAAVQPASFEQPVQLARSGLGHQQLPGLPRASQYGFVDDARELAADTVRLFGQDLRSTGGLHEYYHPRHGRADHDEGVPELELPGAEHDRVAGRPPVSWEF